MNPYWGVNFFEFFIVFFKRLGLLCMGHLHLNNLVADEIQVYLLMCVGISSVLVGVFLNLKKMTMLANSLSHTMLLGIILGYFVMHLLFHKTLLDFNLSMYLVIALITAILTVAMTDLCKRLFKLQEDASIGLTFTFLFALGIVIVTVFSRNLHLGVEIIMGNIDALHRRDLDYSIIVMMINAVITVAFYRYYQMIAFDQLFSKTISSFTHIFYYLLMLQTSLTAISAFRAVGVFLFLIFLTSPILSARLITHKLSKMIVYAILLHIISVVVGVAMTRHILSTWGMPLSTAGLVCIASSLLYPVTLLSVEIQKKVRHIFYRRQLKEVKSI